MDLIESIQYRRWDQNQNVSDGAGIIVPFVRERKANLCVSDVLHAGQTKAILKHRLAHCVQKISNVHNNPTSELQQAFHRLFALDYVREHDVTQAYGWLMGEELLVCATLRNPPASPDLMACGTEWCCNGYLRWCLPSGTRKWKRRKNTCCSIDPMTS